MLLRTGFWTLPDQALMTITRITNPPVINCLQHLTNVRYFFIPLQLAIIIMDGGGVLFAAVVGSAGEEETSIE